MTYKKVIPGSRAVALISLLLSVGAFMPSVAHASVWDTIVSTLWGTTAEAGATLATGNVQTMPLLKPALNIDPSPDQGGGDIVIVDDSVLVPDDGPSGSLSKPKNATISTYVVKQGDTISAIAAMFEVSPDTIRWANDMPRGSQLKVGQKLTILPVTGIKYTVRKGDTLSTIAKRFDGDVTEIQSYNGIDETMLAVGLEIIVPNGEIALPPAPKPSTPTRNLASTPRVVGASVSAGYFSAPLQSYVRTQGVHGYNGVDLAAPLGAPILAAADGEVIVAKRSGYNGGYGAYIVIQHGNGSQTLYAHASSVSVAVGEQVSKGQVIGGVGNSGRSTGPHLHFEIRNGSRNPF